ncbi:hypothetical protein DOY81_005358 [Sarcophaga bullata]|nr:hypothetical protein DOY81_005358 [Sarcophaga bullata]
MADEIPSKKLKLEKETEETKEDEKSPNKGNTTKSTSQTMEAINATTSATATSNNTSNAAPVQQRPKLTFKNPKFSYIEPGGKKFVWKSLKQIVTQEKSLPWPDDVVLYSSLNAPPSLKPAKKYSDISGLEAPYTDPQTKLHYHNAEEFRIIRTLPSDIIQGYLALRGATNIVG